MTRYHGEHPPHSTCLDVGAMHQKPGTEWVCGANCPIPGDTKPRVTTYEEWRVTGTWLQGRQTDLIWRTADGETEEEARSYIALVQNGDWTDGPHLHKRTVTVTDWEDA